MSAKSRMGKMEREKRNFKGKEEKKTGIIIERRERERERERESRRRKKEK